jgi:hypothetical protein
VWVELDRKHAPCGTRKLGSEPAAARTEIENQVVGTNAGAANEIRSERLGPEEMLATRAARRTRTACASLGHEPSPSSSSAADHSHGQAG